MLASTSAASASNVIVLGWRASAITQEIERDRLIACGGKARDLRREGARATANAVQENDGNHNGLPSRTGVVASPSVCISRLAQANIATA